MQFASNSYTDRIKEVSDYLILNPTAKRMERYKMMKEAITGSKLYQVSSAMRQDKMDMEYLSLLRLLK